MRLRALGFSRKGDQGPLPSLGTPSFGRSPPHRRPPRSYLAAADHLLQPLATKASFVWIWLPCSTLLQGKNKKRGSAVMVAMSGSNSFVKEMAIRKRVSSIFNKREEDFPSLREYNDYLEEVEDMTFNLIEGVDVEAIEANISKYRKENAEQIINAQARKAEELAIALKASKTPVQTDTTDLAAGLSSQTTGTGLQGQYAPATLSAAGLLQPRPTGMVPQPLPIGGPSVHTHGYAVEEGMNLREEKAARAGGWTVDLSRKRALEEAFNSIWI